VDECENVIAFVQKIQELYSPIPDAVINNIIAQAGCSTSDPRVARIFNVVAQKLIVEILNEFSGKKEIQLPDVVRALSSRGFPVYRPEFIVRTTEGTEHHVSECPTDFFRDTSLTGF
jgi:S-adenosylmethionine synthetase